MRRSDADARVVSSSKASVAIDWRSWLALAWAFAFGLLYARMVVEERAPHVWNQIQRLATFF